MEVLPNSTRVSKILSQYVKNRDNHESTGGGFNSIFIFKKAGQTPDLVLRIAYHVASSTHETEKTIDNWRRADQLGVTPTLHFIGLARIDDVQLGSAVSTPNEPHLVMVMDAFDFDLENYAMSLAIEDRYGELRDIIKKSIKQVWKFTTELGIGCIDTRPANIVVNHENGRFDVRLIDLDFPYCKDTSFHEDRSLAEAHAQGAFVVCICMLALHTLKTMHINLFLPFLNVLLKYQDTKEGGAKSAKTWHNISLSSVKDAYIFLEAEHRVYFYFRISSFEDFWFLATQPWPDPDHIAGLPEYYMHTYKNRKDTERTKSLISNWGSAVDKYEKALQSSQVTNSSTSIPSRTVYARRSESTESPEKPRRRLRKRRHTSVSPSQEEYI